MDISTLAMRNSQIGSFGNLTSSWLFRAFREFSLVAKGFDRSIILKVLDRVGFRSASLKNLLNNRFSYEIEKKALCKCQYIFLYYKYKIISIITLLYVCIVPTLYLNVRERMKKREKMVVSNIFYILHRCDVY